VSGALRLALYMMIPFVIYLSDAHTVHWMSERLTQFYNLSFGVLIVFVILTLKFTKRKKGFTISPMDFLILFVALVVPNLPDERIQSYHMGLVAAKIIVLFFSYEVLIGELRGKMGKLVMSTMAALIIFSVNGWIG